MWLKIRQNQCVIELNKHQQPNIDKSYLEVKDLFESKYQLLINEREKVGTIESKHLKRFINYSKVVEDLYENLEDCNPTK